MSERLKELRAALKGRYEIERQVGQGGMATVYLARDVRHQREVAIKVLRPDLAAALGPERFLREIRIAANLPHPHILPLYDSGEADGFLYYVMPYVEGDTLRTRIEKEGELPVAEAVKIIREIADALAFAHSKGVVHRDIKPDNVMLTGGHAVVTDFGVAKAISEATGRDKLTTAGVALGTPAYMAPEQATADPHIDHRADIYAIGAVAYELLTGRTPFTGATPQSILAAHVTEQVDPVSKYRDHVTAELEAVVMRCLEKKPADRWQSAEELLPHLEAAATPTGGLTPTSTRPMSVASEPVRSSRRPLYIGIGAVVTLAAVWGVFGTRTTGGSGASSELPRLLVLPAQNLGGAEMAYYADGLSEEVSARLTSLSGLEVIGRFSAEQYRDTDKSPQQIGEELNTEYILSLRVRSGGSTASSPVRVSAELLRASSAVQLWSQSYTARELDDLFDMMGDVASNVAGELGLTLASAEQQTLSARPTESQEAWDYYLQGTVANNRGTDPDNFREAAEHFQRAVTLDGDFALAWAGLAEAHLEVHWFDGRRFPERVEMARDALDRAAQLDPGSFELRLARGIYYYHGSLDYDRALEEFDAAKNIKPNDAEVHAWAAFVYRRQGNMEGALASLERALELDPRSGFAVDLGETRVILGRFSEARSPLRLSITLDPTDRLGSLYLAFNFLGEGNLAEAQNVLRAFSEHVPLADLTGLGRDMLIADDELQDRVLAAALSESVPDTGAFYLAKAFLLRARGDMPTARAMADSGAAVYQARIRRVPDAAFSHSSLGITYAIAGRRDLALEHGRRAIELLPISADYWEGGERIFALALMHLLLGETDVALSMLRELIDTHQVGPFWRGLLQYHPLYAPYREDSTFRALYE